MLVLMRRPGESIHIGSNVIVTLVTVDRNRARIGITAPKHIAVDREEIAERKRLDELIALDEAAAEENADEDDEAQP